MIVASVLKGTGPWSHRPVTVVGQRAQEEDSVESGKICMHAQSDTSRINGWRLGKAWNLLELARVNCGWA